MNHSDQAVIDDIIDDAQRLLKKCETHGLAWSVYHVSVVIDGLNKVEALGAPVVEDGTFDDDSSAG
jgi:hypothetical protein